MDQAPTDRRDVKGGPAGVPEGVQTAARGVPKGAHLTFGGTTRTQKTLRIPQKILWAPLWGRCVLKKKHTFGFLGDVAF